MHEPHVQHWKAIKRILRYLKHTPTVGLQISPSTDFNITTFLEANWVGCPNDWHSTSWYCIFFCHHLVSCSSKKQNTVAHSSIIAEFKAVTNTTAEVIWLQSICRDLRITPTRAPLIYYDILSVTYISSNPVFHTRTKHVEITFTSSVIGSSINHYMSISSLERTNSQTY